MNALLFVGWVGGWVGREEERGRGPRIASTGGWLRASDSSRIRV